MQTVLSSRQPSTFVSLARDTPCRKPFTSREAALDEARRAAKLQTCPHRGVGKLIGHGTLFGYAKRACRLAPASTMPSGTNCHRRAWKSPQNHPSSILKSPATSTWPNTSGYWWVLDPTGCQAVPEGSSCPPTTFEFHFRKLLTSLLAILMAIAVGVSEALLHAAAAGDRWGCPPPRTTSALHVSVPLGRQAPSR